jgi:hypothetical protein
MRAKCFLQRIKLQWDKVAEEYCWAITQAVGPSCCGRSGSSVLEGWFQLDSLVHTYIVDHTHTQFRLVPDFPERSYCVIRRVFSITPTRMEKKSEVSVSISCLLALISTQDLPNTKRKRKSSVHNDDIRTWIKFRSHLKIDSLRITTAGEGNEVFLFPMVQQPLLGQGLLIIEAPLSHSDTPHSIGLVWTSDQPDAETSTWQHRHSQETDIHASSGIRTRNPSKRAAANPRLRLRGHWDRQWSKYLTELPIMIWTSETLICFWRRWIRGTILTSPTTPLTNKNSVTETGCVSVTMWKKGTVAAQWKSLEEQPRRLNLFGKLRTMVNVRHNASHTASLKTLPDVPEDRAQVEFWKSRNWVYIYIYIYGQICMYVHTWEPSWNPKSKTLEHDRPQHNRNAVCVIAQEYSSATFVWLVFNSS